MECQLLPGRHVLLTNSPDSFLAKNFFGRVITKAADLPESPEPGSILYVESSGTLQESPFEVTLHIGKDIDEGAVPINVHNVGVFIRKAFPDGKDYYRSITQEHEFQVLGMGRKPGIAHRKGIYLTPVEQKGNELWFRLLRCSTNLDGPTDNFRATDWEIVTKANDLRAVFFQDGAELNHVLAQTYHNTVDDEAPEGRQPKERKARIAEHSDKTKDMPSNGLMAFVTFYDFSDCDQGTAALHQAGFDWVYGSKGVSSALTRLRFRLKDDVKDETLAKEFDITLYPNSMFLMPLRTNRLYTHEIIPSILPVSTLPTRIGYVIRCSNKQAVSVNGETFVVEDETRTKLEPPTPQGIERLKDIYYTENTTSQPVTYEGFYFSMNQGDYLAPLL